MSASTFARVPGAGPVHIGYVQVLCCYAQVSFELNSRPCLSYSAVHARLIPSFETVSSRPRTRPPPRTVLGSGQHILSDTQVV